MAYTPIAVGANGADAVNAINTLDGLYDPQTGTMSVDNLKVSGDTGWKPLTTFSSSFAPYVDQEYPMYKIKDGWVTITGRLRPTGNIAGSPSPVDIATLPAEIVSSSIREFFFAQIGSGNSKWMLVVSGNKLNFSRYADNSITNGSGFSQATPSTWLPFTVTYPL